MKKVILLLVVLCLLSCVSCAEKKVLHCDGCGIEIKVKSSSNMDEDWIIYCNDCNKDIIDEESLFEED